MVGLNPISPPKEVDFYHNPTELFRWINYRRWDGAINRAQACPEEVSTWIVSKDNDKSILWRHLPLHLCCMQATIPYNLVELLIKVYPEGAECQDHEGMTPLHVACLKGGITEKIAILLLAYNPASVRALDKENRTPLEILHRASAQEKDVNTTRKNVLKLMINAQNHLNQVSRAIKEEERARIDALTKSTSNERVAAQQQIMKIQEELAEANSTIKKLESDVKTRKDIGSSFEQEILSLQKQLEKSGAEKDAQARKIKNLEEEILQKQSRLEEHGNVVSGIQDAAQEENAKLREDIQSLRSEISTARAMNEALESKLKQKFTGEENLSVQIRQLETALKEAENTRLVLEKKFGAELAQLEQENSELKDAMEDITKDNLILQAKLKELSDTVSNLLASQNILSAEQDRLVLAAEKSERDLIDCMQTERTRLVALIEKQRGFLNEVFAEQERTILSADKMEKKLRAAVGTERERALEAIRNVKKAFKDAEAAERERRKSGILRPYLAQMENDTDKADHGIGAMASQTPQRGSGGKAAKTAINSDVSSPRIPVSARKQGSHVMHPFHLNTNSPGPSPRALNPPTMVSKQLNSKVSVTNVGGLPERRAADESKREFRSSKRNDATQVDDTSSAALSHNSPTVFSQGATTTSEETSAMSSLRSDRQMEELSPTQPNSFRHTKAASIDSGRFLKLEDVGQTLLSGNNSLRRMSQRQGIANRNSRSNVSQF